MNHLLRYLWFNVVIRPLVLLVMGVNIRNRERLSSASPAIVVANHNSHLDTMVLVSLFPSAALRRIRPVAAEDYFLKNRWLAWFALKIIGIVPVVRGQKGRKTDPLAGCSEALSHGDTLLLFPEGSRGEPERLAKFKSGVAHLAQRHPDIPVIPVFMQGLGKALPKGEWVLVPIVCDVLVGEPIRVGESRQAFMQELETQMNGLSEQVQRNVFD